MKKRKTPAIRFKGFTDDWEQCSFDTLYKKVNIKNNLEYNEKDIISVANMYYKPISYISNKEYLKTYNVFKLGDIAFEGNKSKDFAYGRFVENTIGNGIVSHVFDVFSPIMEYDIYFWKYAINNEKIMKNILIRSTKSSTMMTNLVADDFLKEHFFRPAIQEQQQIGEFFSKLDNLITFHQRKYEKLQILKKAMLEKMFPKNGAKIPEIRFKGFNDDWEQYEFGKIVFRKNSTCSNPYLSRVEYEDIIPGIGKLNKDIKRKKCNKLGIAFKKNDILYGKLRPYLQNWIFCQFEGIAVGDFWVLSSNILDNIFIYFFIQTQFFCEISNLSIGTKMPRADWNLISQTYFYFPLKNESTNIGEFFSKLDNLITLHQRKIEKLQTIKKAMLEKMFI